jgi:hypothetical protein
VTETVEARSHGTPEALMLHAQYLDALTKEQLLRLTGDLDVEGQSTMSKQELIEPSCVEEECVSARSRTRNCFGSAEHRL